MKRLFFRTACIVVCASIVAAYFIVKVKYAAISVTSINNFITMSETTNVIGVVQYKTLTQMTVKTNYYSFYAMKKNAKLNGYSIRRLGDFDCILSNRDGEFSYRCNYDSIKNILTVVSNDYSNNLLPVKFMINTEYN